MATTLIYPSLLGMSQSNVYEFFNFGNPGITCLSGPFLLFLMLNSARGGSIPLVALLTTEELSDGICADSVLCLSPYCLMSFLNCSQAILVLCGTISSTSFL